MESIRELWESEGWIRCKALRDLPAIVSHSNDAQNLSHKAVVFLLCSIYVAFYFLQCALQMIVLHGNHGKLIISRGAHLWTWFFSN